MRIVFDTNIFIAAALKGGFAKNIIEFAVAHIVTLIASEEIFAELKEKLLTKFFWQEQAADFFVDQIRVICEVVSITEKITIITRDPDDNHILACAVSGKADLIVSADRDLITLKTYQGIPIIHPKTLSYTFPQYFKKKTT